MFEEEIISESCNQYKKKCLNDQCSMVGYLNPHCLKLRKFLMSMTDITVDASSRGCYYGYIVVNFSDLM